MIYGCSKTASIAIVAFQIFGQVQKSYYFTTAGSGRASVDQGIDHADMGDGAAVHTAQSKMMRNSQLARGQDTRLQKSFDTNFDTG